jgi:hypothetical protein
LLNRTLNHSTSLFFILFFLFPLTPLRRALKYYMSHRSCMVGPAKGDKMEINVFWIDWRPIIYFKVVGISYYII